MAARKTLSATAAVIAAQEAGETLETTKDEAGEELIQRPVSLGTGTSRKSQAAGKRVNVYHKRRTTMHLTDCKLGPEAEGSILASDAEHPNVKPYIILTR